MSRFANSAATVPEPCRIFGTALRPFCLGHHLLFKRLDLPFDEKGNPTPKCTRDAIMIAVAVCAASYETTLELLLNGEWDAFVSDWMRRVKGPFWRRRKVNWFDTEFLFRAYLSDGYQEPPIWDHTRTVSIALSAPWEEMLKCRLVMAGFSESEVLNGYLPCRWYDYFTVTEMSQADKCRRPEHWKKIFYTKKDHDELKGAE
jgi:hypothetical protein